MTKGAGPDVRSFSSPLALSQALAEGVAQVCSDGPRSNALFHNPLGRTSYSKPFTVAISGGSLPKLLAGGVLSSNHAIPWENWHVFFVDERVVGLDDADSNYKMCKAMLFDRVPIPPANIHHILLNSASANGASEAEAAADAYEEELRKVFGNVALPVFDLVLLGMGPDGHTASLFPDDALLSVEDRWVASIEDSPKPPSKRITLTFPVINAARHVFFVCTGSSKAASLAKVLNTKANARDSALPAARVQPASGNLVWFVDDAASEQWRNQIAGSGSNMWNTYKTLLVRHPIRTKAVTSAFMGALGELLAQVVASRRATLRRNTLAFFATGLVFVGPWFHAWQQVLERLVPAKNTAAIIAKLFVDRIIGAPPYLYINLFLVALFNGKTMREARTKTNSIIVGAFKTSIPYWTLVNLYIIARVQPQLRPLYGNIASIFWSLYMSSLN